MLKVTRGELDKRDKSMLFNPFRNYVMKLVFFTAARINVEQSRTVARVAILLN